MPTAGAPRTSCDFATPSSRRSRKRPPIEGSEPLRLLLDADLSSHALVGILTAHHDVLAAGFDDDLQQLEDRISFTVAQEQRRVMVTHNTHDFPDILREWGEARRPHHGCIISTLPTNAYGEMSRRFERWFEQSPSPKDWIDRAVYL